MDKLTQALIRPIVGIENRTAQEVFDIMCDRFRGDEALSRTESEPDPDCQRDLRDEP